MATTTHPRPAVRIHRSVTLDPALRQHRLEVARWALAHGRPLNLDSITVVLAARRHEAALEHRPFTRWSTTSLLTFLFGTCVQWCEAQGVARPATCGETLLTYLDHLADTGQLATGSTPIDQLRRTVAHLTGLSEAGFRSEPAPSRQFAVPTPIRSS